MNLPSYGLIADNQENPMISRVSVIRIVEQEAQNMRRAAGPGDRAMAGALRERILKALNECGTSMRANNPGNVADYLMTEVLDRAAAIERSQTPQRANSQDGQHES